MPPAPACTAIMAVAKTGFVHARCMTLLHTNDFQRDYRAVCDGLPPQPEGDIDLPLGRAEGSLLKRCPDPHGQSAHTHYQVLSAANGRALLRLTPTTGRTHQLPAHRRLALWHGGSHPHRPPCPPQLSPADGPPRHRRRH